VPFDLNWNSNLTLFLIAINNRNGIAISPKFTIKRERNNSIKNKNQIKAADYLSDRYKRMAKGEKRSKFTVSASYSKPRKF